MTQGSSVGPAVSEERDAVKNIPVPAGWLEVEEWWADEWRRQVREQTLQDSERERHEEKRGPGSFSRDQLDVKASVEDYQGNKTTVDPRARSRVGQKGWVCREGHSLRNCGAGQGGQAGCISE